MGLDPLEIAFRLEKRFGIRIRPNPAVEFLTAGTLCDAVWQVLQGIQPGTADWAELSKQLDAALPPAPDRRWWSRSATFEELFENGDLENNWRRFQRSLRLSLPPVTCCEKSGKLRLPRGFRTHASVMFWISQNHPDRVTWITEPTAIDRPPGAETVTREECWLAVREILADVLALDPEQIVPESLLYEDLGME